MFPLALACGNTFILKPSEKVSLSITRAIELLQEAGLPSGVLNLVHGGKALSDGRGTSVPGAPHGFCLGATVIDEVDPISNLAQTEVFGPVLSIMRAESLDQAIEIANASAFGNGTAIFTTSGHAAREFKHRVKAGMVGINVGVPAPMAMFPFSGWDRSFYGDLHVQGRDGVRFYTREKTVTSRWFGEADVWRK